jgi:hypothetical protein
MEPWIRLATLETFPDHNLGIIEVDRSIESLVGIVVIDDSKPFTNWSWMKLRIIAYGCRNIVANEATNAGVEGIDV